MRAEPADHRHPQRARESAVVNVGPLHGGDAKAPNIIPSEVIVRGAARSYKSEIRDLLERRLKELATSCTIRLRLRGPARLSRWLSRAGEPRRAERDRGGRGGGAGRRSQRLARRRTAHVLRGFLLHAAGAFIFIGGGTQPDGEAPFLHTPDYDFNDRIVTLGAAYWMSLVQVTLGSAAGPGA